MMSLTLPSLLLLHEKGEQLYLMVVFINNPLTYFYQSQISPCHPKDTQSVFKECLTVSLPSYILYGTTILMCLSIGHANGHLKILTRTQCKFICSKPLHIQLILSVSMASPRKRAVTASGGKSGVRFQESPSPKKPSTLNANGIFSPGITESDDDGYAYLLPFLCFVFIALFLLAMSKHLLRNSKGF